MPKRPAVRGFRIDAARHISAHFLRDFIKVKKKPLA
jgi:glycosidase